MKKFIFISMLVCLLSSGCSDKGCEIQIDEVKFVPTSSSDKIEDYAKMSSLFEVITGKYPISWELIGEYPGGKKYKVELKLKFRLKRRVEINPKVFEGLKHQEEAGLELFKGFHVPYTFTLHDANDEEIKTFTFDVNLGRKGHEPFYNNDKSMDFFLFLTSNPGTEKEFVLNALATVDSYSNTDGLKEIKSAKSLKCETRIPDYIFSEKYGTIE